VLLSNKGGKFASDEDEIEEEGTTKKSTSKVAEEESLPAEAAEVEDVSDDIPF
jgi:hypothetical protein